MSQQEQFDTVFAKLKAILLEHQGALVVTADEGGNYYLGTPALGKDKKPVFFGGVQTKKNYVSYHLMPVYSSPELLEGMSPKLKKRMQGKSCFNFTSVDEETFEELAGLTRKGLDRFREDQLA